MKNIALLLFFVTLLLSCHTTTRLAIPTVFKEQASMLHVSGSRGNKMSFGNYSSSKIKRGMHVSYPGWGRGFILENILWNQIGLQKKEHVQKEKAKFRYTLSDGKNNVEIFGKENELIRTQEYKVSGNRSIFNGLEIVKEHQYIFAALISTDITKDEKSWDLVMSNVYDQKNNTPKDLPGMIRSDDYGMATNGKDTIFIKPVTTKNIESTNGKAGRMPIKMLSGYELNTKDGTIAIIDSIDQNIWFYNELNDADKLMVAAITTALFARRVNDTKW
jgi:hypothetical protein